ncbi:hypothetical protein L3073_01455 [Ancylomarina sp. DW003]|nr:hypothetical protein [Ancylomarina sp. DW003]MDE5420867.1 hypothetical protein [Ancylomarina sp. DW003]
MRMILSLVTFVFLNLAAFSQDKLVVLHHIVGDTIDIQEQRDFILFSDILDQEFNSATIHFHNSKYLMHVNSDSGLKTVELTEKDIEENREHVDKLVKYFKSLVERNDSLWIEERTSETWPKYQAKILTDDQRRTIAKDAIKYFDLNQDAEDLGLWGLEKENYIKVNSKSCLIQSVIDILK